MGSRWQLAGVVVVGDVVVRTWTLGCDATGATGALLRCGRLVQLD